ncbi:RNA polymerase sigma factor [uncultured Devosia sp.]|uniref:RNA polymerase sigma factor n=1 Tax=uncultured Devosia sp. TaxID=211434 RepID=UPI0035CC33B9
MGLSAASLIAGPADAARLLVARAQKGDSDAFAALIEAHYDVIYRTAYKWSGNRSDAEDVAQDVCVKLGQAIASFDGRSAFSSWLYRITLNGVRDLQRARSRRTKYTDALARVSPERALPEQEEAATSGQLWDAVRRLPEQQRDAVLLVYAEELSHAAAGQIMGCKEATVSWHIHEAKKTLRGLL